MNTTQTSRNQLEDCWCGRRGKWYFIDGENLQTACGYHYGALPEPTWKVES